MILYYVWACHDTKDSCPSERDYWTTQEPAKIIEEELSCYLPTTIGLHEAVVSGEDFDFPLVHVQTKYSTEEGNAVWKAGITLDDQRDYASLTYSAYEVNPDDDKAKMIELMKHWLADANPADVRNMLVFLRKRIG